MRLDHIKIPSLSEWWNPTEVHTVFGECLMSGAIGGRIAVARQLRPAPLSEPTNCQMDRESGDVWRGIHDEK